MTGPSGSKDDLSSSSSSSSSFIHNNTLFPSLGRNKKNNINNNNKFNKDTSPNDDSDFESINQLRNAFISQQQQQEDGVLPSYQHQQDPSTQLRDHYEMEEIDLSDDSIVQARRLSRMNNINTNDTVSLDSSILNKVTTSVVKNEPVAESGRFKYLRLYEHWKKQQPKSTTTTSSEIMIPEDSSVFNLSRLDDFSRFVRETAINDDIYHKIQSKLPKSDIHTQNLLNVVDEADLANNFYGTEEGCEEEGEETSRKKKLFKIKSWKMGSSSNGGGGGGGHSPSLASKSDFSGMNYAQSESSSSNKEPRFLDRKLSVRHLQMISFGGTIGVGLFLNSGKAITIAGGFGAVLAFTIVGVLVLCTLTSFSEMVTFVSVIDGVSGLSSRFIDDAFGFAAGWLYFCSFSFGVAGEIVAAVIMLSYYGHLDTTSNSGSTAGFVCLFLVLIVSSNLLPIRYFGELEYVSSFVKLLWAFIMMVIMVVLNRGGFPNTPVLGFKYWNHSKSDFENNIIFGLFRPSFNLHDSGTDPPGVGIGGDKGRFLSLLTAILVVCYAYSGTEVVCIAACEAKNPRKALPSATRRVFWRIIIFYVISSFLVTLNIYAGDPRLLRYSSGSTGIDASQFGTNPAVIQVGGAHCNADSKVVAGFGSGAQSPWIVALQSASLCQFSSVTNGFLVFFAVSCGNAQLYVSSRTVYSLALQGKAPKIFTYCNRFGTPYNAVLFAGAFGLLAFTCVNESATVVFQNLTSLISSSGIFVWFTMCLTFIRFYFGLKRRPDILDRNDRSYPYKSPFQPYAAIVGAVGTLFIILAMGFVVFLNGQWDTMFFFSSYGSLIAFTALYIGYRVIKGTSIPSLDKLDFDSGRTEMDRYIWDGGRSYNKKNAKEVIYKWISFLA